MKRTAVVLLDVYDMPGLMVLTASAAPHSSIVCLLHEDCAC